MFSAMPHQLSCFSSIRRVHQQTLLSPCSSPRSKPLLVMSSNGSGTEMSSNGSGTEISGSQFKTTLSYTPDDSRSYMDGSVKSYATVEENEKGKKMSELEQEQVDTQQKRAAKIHDFCFGIPFGGIVLGGGLAGFVFTRNPTTLSTVLFGGALLALSTFSLKVWRQGKSSLPLILGQAGLAAALLWKNLQTYSTTMKLFPTGFFAIISAAMLCFYSYVVMSGGNPPPKKLKSSIVAPS